MKKNKKLIITLLVLILLPIVIFTIDFGVQSCVVMNYLCQKYDAKITDFKLVKYTPKHLQILTPLTTDWFDKRYYGSVWEYKYNDRLFNVQKIENTNIYFDDYQLEDISLWTSKYLQENVDSNITNVVVKTSDLFYIFENYDEYRYRPFKESDIVNYWEILEACYIGYKTNNEISINLRIQLEDEINSSFCNKFELRIHSFVTESVSIERIHKDSFWREEHRGRCYVEDSCFIY